MLKDRVAYEAKLERQLAAWETDIAGLKTKAKGLSVDGMIKYDQTVEALQKKHKEAGVHLRNMKAAGDETWEQLKDGTEKVWLEFKAMFKHSSE
jgi:hypothetical protein